MSLYSPRYDGMKRCPLIVGISCDCYSSCYWDVWNVVDFNESSLSTPCGLMIVIVVVADIVVTDYIVANDCYYNLINKHF